MKILLVNSVCGVRSTGRICAKIAEEHEARGWGAVLNEALEEGMEVVGTFEAGASATILPRENLFHAGDWRGLRRLLLSKHEKSWLYIRPVQRWHIKKVYPEVKVCERDGTQEV